MISAVAADPAPEQVEVMVEIYEVPVTAAFTLQKIFASGTQAERDGLLQKLRQKNPPGGIKALAALHGTGAVGTKLLLDSTSEHKYPTAYNLGAVATPTAFEMRQVGWIVQLQLSPMQMAGKAYEVLGQISHVRLDGVRRYRASKADAQGSIEQPYMVSANINMQGTLTSGAPRLAGIFTPYNEGQPMTGLWVVIITAKSQNP